jgi:hypothetical protein
MMFAQAATRRIDPMMIRIDAPRAATATIAAMLRLFTIRLFSALKRQVQKGI